MKRCWRISWLGLFFAILIGLTAWAGTAWLLKPKPQHIVVKDYFHSILNSGFNQKELHDSTGWWIARANPMAPLQVVGEWIAFDLKTGEAQRLTWASDYDKPFVPIPNGYRHVRTAPDGTLEIVDTLFSDGSSTVRLHLPPGTLISPWMLFNHDGSRAVTLQPFPHSLLRVLGNLNGPAWDALAVAHLQTENNVMFHPISLDALQVEVWDVPSSQLRKAFLLPPLTTTRNLQFSPNGRWLIRPETPLHPDYLVFKRYRSLIVSPPRVIQAVAAHPRGILVFDCDTGGKVEVPVSYQDPKEGAYVIYVQDGGLAFATIMIDSLDIPIFILPPRMTVPPMKDEDYPLHRLPDGQSVRWIGISGSDSTSDIPPIRTIDGCDVTTVKTERNKAVAIVSLDDDGIQIRSTPVQLHAEDSIKIEPTNQPGQILATWKAERWPIWIENIGYKFGLDLNAKFPCNSSISFALVDVHRAKILLEDHISYDPKTSSPEYKLTHDRSAILLTELKDRDLHITRWDLPISIWSPWWGREAGLISVMFILLLVRKRRGTPDAQNSANLYAASPLSSPDRFACGQAVN